MNSSLCHFKTAECIPFFLELQHFMLVEPELTKRSRPHTLLQSCYFAISDRSSPARNTEPVMQSKSSGFAFARATDHASRAVA